MGNRSKSKSGRVNNMDIRPTKKDKIIAKDAVAVVVEEVVKLVPGLNLAYGLSKALYGSGLKLRQQRALEWVEMVRDNPEVFTKLVLEDQAFQDGFAFALEKYLTERNEEKRQISRNIFLGFVQAQDKTKFPLEKYVHTLSQLGEVDIEVLGNVDTSQTGRNYQIYGHNFSRIENIYNLIGLGLLLDVTGNRIGQSPEESPFVKPTFFCKEFVNYLIK